MYIHLKSRSTFNIISHGYFYQKYEKNNEMKPGQKAVLFSILLYITSTIRVPWITNFFSNVKKKHNDLQLSQRNECFFLTDFS